MRIAFVNAPFKTYYSRNQRSPAVTKGGTFYYPFWLALACGFAQKSGHEAVLYDFIASDTPCDEAISILKKNSFQLVVVDITTPSVFHDVSFSDDVKKKIPGSIVMLVGTHVTALPEETLKMSKYIDLAAITEYDRTVVEVANAFEKGKSFTNVKGICFRHNQGFQRTAPQRLMTGEELDTLPFVSEIYKKFLNIKNYYFAAARHPMVMIITGRGCPFACNFCIYWQTLHGKVYRKRSAENVAAEFEYIAGELPFVKEIIIEDDTFTADIPRVQKICRILIERKNKLPWSANVRVGIDLETMCLMKKAGCRLLITGFESGDQKVLDNMGKHIRIGMSYDHMEFARKAGLLVHGCFMFGNPGETKETMEKTMKLAVELNCDSAQFYPLFVYPGTKSYAWFEERNLIATKDFRLWLKENGEHNTVIKLPGISSDEIVVFCENAYLRYHLRPAYLWLKTKQLFSNPAEGFRSLRSAFNFFKTKLT